MFGYKLDPHEAVVSSLLWLSL